eukprot:Gregarina_sp_Poly_1__7609@NODE_426_length_8588_cov_216_941204_g347_i0_p9_GENE_NODE_426_length_8588_cov_216_941204_g347_i0NODE_426_length_8588_cov_216_941204_g347_i0_p9_ORF_typecomplete_len126_score12_65_NODE_426_length_8588_cov_216_941204_g347_i076057982
MHINKRFAPTAVGRHRRQPGSVWLAAVSPVNGRKLASDGGDLPVSPPPEPKQPSPPEPLSMSLDDSGTSTWNRFSPRGGYRRIWRRGSRGGNWNQPRHHSGGDALQSFVKPTLSRHTIMPTTGQH